MLLQWLPAKSLSNSCLTFLAILVGFLLLCMLSRAATDASPQGRFGVNAVKATVRDLLKASERARSSALQDGFAFLALDHAVEARVLAQTASALVVRHGLDVSLVREAADAMASAKQHEEELVAHLDEQLGGVSE